MQLNAFILCLLIIINFQTGARYYCPPANFVNNSRRSVVGLKTAIISEIHGQVWAKTHSWGPFWTQYYNGDQLARSLFNHAGILGIDKVYLGVFYNETLYPRGPSVEDIYPSDKYCVSDWHKLGVLEWRPVPFGGPVQNWPVDKDGKPTQDRDYYKTLRVYNPFYAGKCDVMEWWYSCLCGAEIKDKYDWVFVMDVDEYLTPVNFNASIAPIDWCSMQRPSFISRILHQMLAIATRHKLSSFDLMMKAYKERDVLTGEGACPRGWSFNEVRNRCRPITSISMPVYLWLRKEGSPERAIPTIRSIFPGCYSDRLKESAQDGQEELWKSVYQTRHSQLLEGRSLHDNPTDNRKVSTILAPRSFHGGLSLEIVHQRQDNWILNDTMRRMTTDHSLIALVDAYKQCMKRVHYAKGGIL